jgi:hypothetical protein
MKIQRVVNLFSVLNLLFLGLLLIQTPSTAQQSVAPLLRARAIELVDERGKVRAQLDVEATGEVVFRLRDAKGTIRSKFGANEDGSGLSMMDDRTEATVQIRSNQSGASVTVIDREGRARVVK